jgi:hypothetical protein
MVPPPVEVALGQVIALPGEVERLPAGQLLAAGRELLAGVDRAHRAGQAQFHPAERVDHLLKAGEVEHRGPVEPDPGQLGHDPGQQLRAAAAAAAHPVRGIDLVFPMAGDRDPQIPWDRDQVRLLQARRDVHDHDRVR